MIANTISYITSKLALKYVLSANVRIEVRHVKKSRKSFYKNLRGSAGKRTRRRKRSLSMQIEKVLAIREEMTAVVGKSSKKVWNHAGNWEKRTIIFVRHVT